MPTDLIIHSRFEGRGLGIPKFGPKTLNIDIAGTKFIVIKQDIPTTAAGTLVVFPASILTLGPAWLINHADPTTQSTQYLELGRQSGGVFLGSHMVKPGWELPCCFAASLATNALYARANGATTALTIAVAEQ